MQAQAERVDRDSRRAGLADEARGGGGGGGPGPYSLRFGRTRRGRASEGWTNAWTSSSICDGGGMRRMAWDSLPHRRRRCRRAAVLNRVAVSAAGAERHRAVAPWRLHDRLAGVAD